MKTIKKLTLLGIIFTMLLFQNCGPLKQLSYDNGEFCQGKSILKYQTLRLAQKEHKDLYNNYISRNEEDSVLINFEKSKLHYSLRKKDNDMDDGIIPDDPDFNSFDYTTDDTLEAMLNQDGMIIIGDEIYIWDDGCIIHKMKYNCSNYNVLIDYRSLLRTYSQTPTQALLLRITNLRTTYKISDINTCDDISWDFEFLSEDNINLPDKYNPNTANRSSGCGYDAFITEEFISNDPVNKKIRYKLTANTIQVAGSNPGFLFYIKNVTNRGEVKIVDGSLPNYINTDWFDLSADDNGLLYPGKWLEIEADYNLINSLDVSLISNVDLFTGGSCSSSDRKTLDLICPISISKKPLNAGIGQWQFNIEGITINSGVRVVWNFGDGNTIVTTGRQGVIHQYSIPCEEKNYSVSATIEDTAVCNNPISVDNIIVIDPCKADRRRIVHKFKIDGKRGCLVVKIKNKWYITRITKFKNKFKWRKSGEKSITASGNVYVAQGNICTSVNLKGLFNPTPGNPKTLNKKKKLKQKFSDGNHYSFDRNAPYQVTFSHSNSNFVTKTMQFYMPCSN